MQKRDILPSSNDLVQWRDEFEYKDMQWGGLPALEVKNPPANAGDIHSLLWEDPLEECMATHSGIFAWRIPWIEEPGGLQPMGLHKVGHDWRGLACIYMQ